MEGFDHISPKSPRPFNWTRDYVVNLSEEIKSAASRIAPYIIRTPLRRSQYLSKLLSAEIFLKCENLQHTGSFKIRGAFNALLGLDSERVGKEVLTASTGNHGLAVAYAASQLGIGSSIVLPRNAALNKAAKIKQFGSRLRFFGDDALESEREARRLAEETRQIYLSPYNDLRVIAGQGTIGVELLDELPQLDVVLASVGGGGLISGVASYCKAVRESIQIIGCSPERSPVMHRSVQSGYLIDDTGEETLSDGTAGGVEQGSVTFPFCQKLVDRWVLVSEVEIAATMQNVFEREQMRIEGAAAVAVAGLNQLKENLIGKTVAVIICGGNVGHAAEGHFFVSSKA